MTNLNSTIINLLIKRFYDLDVKEKNKTNIIFTPSKNRLLTRNVLKHYAAPIIILQ